MVETEQAPPDRTGGAKKQCPKCKEWIHKNATICPHCRSQQPPPIWAVVAALLIVLIVFIWISRSCATCTSPTANRTDGRQVNGTSAPQTDLEVTASLSNSRVGADAAGVRSHFFDVEVNNKAEHETTVYVVIYAKNDTVIPPRRTAWPMPGFLFRGVNTSRGQLTPSDITRTWHSRDEFSRGWKVSLPSGGAEKMTGALPLNESSEHEAWRGQPLDPRATYIDWQVWVFSQNGRLAYQRSYSK